MEDDILLKLVTPLMEYLKSSYDPYCKIEIADGKVRIIRTEKQVIIESQS